MLRGGVLEPGNRARLPPIEALRRRSVEARRRLQVLLDPGQGFGQHLSIGRLQVGGVLQLVRELKDAFLDTRVWMAAGEDEPDEAQAGGRGGVPARAVATAAIQPTNGL